MTVSNSTGFDNAVLLRLYTSVAYYSESMTFVITDSTTSFHTII